MKENELRVRLVKSRFLLQMFLILLTFYSIIVIFFCEGLIKVSVGYAILWAITLNFRIVTCLTHTLCVMCGQVFARRLYQILRAWLQLFATCRH